MEHILDRAPEPFTALQVGTCRFVLSSRDVEVGDTLVVREREPATGRHTGQVVRLLATYVQRQQGFVIASVRAVGSVSSTYKVSA